MFRKFNQIGQHTKVRDKQVRKVVKDKDDDEKTRNKLILSSGWIVID